MPNRADAAAYQVLWGAAYTNGSGTIAYSCSGVTIQSSTGTLSATTFSGAGTGLTGTASSLSIGGNSATVGGLSVHSGTNNEANKIVRTDGNGYINAGWINTISGDNGGTTISRVYASQDGYIRYYTLANFTAQIASTGGTWNGSINGNAATATTLSGDSSNWASLRTSAVANMLSWKNYGNGHVIFDASAGTSPSGASINNTNPGSNWTGTYPTLMGWNGSSTYGVRVDVCRYADSAGSITSQANSATTTAATAATANTIVLRDGSGHITGNYIFSSYNNSSDDVSSGTVSYIMAKFGDNYHRSATAAKVATFISGQSMNISGTATNITAYTINQSVGTGNNVTFNRVLARASGISLGTGNSSQLEINNAGGGSCNISFHREGAYGAHFGLDAADNWFSTYGWSAGSGYTNMRVGAFAANGAITATGTVTAYYSDNRLKTRISPITNALNKISTLNGFYFRGNEVAGNLGYDTQKVQVGVSAQEVENILPEIIERAPISDKANIDYKTLDYAKLVPLLIESIKELNYKVDYLKNEVEMLKSTK